MPFNPKRYLRENIHDTTIALVGAGGNGSFMLTNLARINYALRMMDRKGLSVMVYDNDTVSESNVGRQLFSPSDVGRNKAEVIVERVNRAFSTSWEAVDKMVTDEYALKMPGANLMITAVDNVQARRNAYKAFLNSKKNYDRTKGMYWMDMGNGKDYGQIILTDGEDLPGLFDMYPDLEDTEQDGPSCSMQQALARQDLFVNSIVTQFAGKLLFDVLTKSELDYHGSFINLKTMDLKPIKI